MAGPHAPFWGAPTCEGDSAEVNYEHTGAYCDMHVSNTRAHGCVHSRLTSTQATSLNSRAR